METELPEEETDVVNQLIAIATQRLTDVQNATSAANTAASNANQKAQEAENAAEDARAVTDQITKDSYLHTALQSFIDTVTATPTAYGNAIAKKIEGFIRQETTQGLNLFDYTKINTIESSGAKLTNNGDGSFTITGSGNLTDSFSINYTMSHEDSVKYFPAGKFNVCRSTVYPAFFMQMRTSGGNKNISSASISTGSLEITEEDRSDPDFYIQFLFWGDTGQAISGGTIKPMAWASENVPINSNWEPYTGGQPAPNPDYPMEVQGTGYSGFFDGELLQGYYKTADGILSTGMDYVCNKNMIPCKPGDNIALDISISSSAVFLLYYDTNGKYVSHKALNTGSHFKMIVPASIYGFNFDIQKSGGLTPDAVGPITITINGKYAVCVKSEGINLCSEVESGAYLHSNGKPSSTENYVRTNKMIVKPNTVYRESSVIEGAVTKTAVFWDKNKTFIKYLSFDSDIQTPSNCKYMALNYNADGLTVSKVRDVMITEKSVFPNTYIPYQSNVTYIPVDYPLFEGDKIIQRNGEYLLVRKYDLTVFDGDSSENWRYSEVDGENTIRFAISAPRFTQDNGEIYCNAFLKRTGAVHVDKEYILETAGSIYVNILNTRLSSLDTTGFKTWLQSNPLTVVCELATPTEEPLSPEAQKALYSIMATDEQTELTIVGVLADVDIQNQFLLPRNEDGALNTTAYCTAEKNKIVLNELAAQNLDARVNKLEIDNAALAEQTIIVE